MYVHSVLRVNASSCRHASDHTLYKRREHSFVHPPGLKYALGFELLKIRTQYALILQSSGSWP